MKAFEFRLDLAYKFFFVDLASQRVRSLVIEPFVCFHSQFLQFDLPNFAFLSGVHA